jgi:pimeloyl-ACP methyl ester carboxylesterase
MIELKRSAVQANGLRFATLEAGDGPLVLCLHGFPDHARSFRHQFPALAAAGFRAVAPFMRGYAPSEQPADGRYQSAVLAQDIVALISALGYSSAHVFGHDWGAVAAYGAAILAPDKVTKLVTAAVPHGPAVINAFMSNYDQQRCSWYMFFFQHPLADAAVAHDDFRFIERLWQDWSPGWRYPTDEMEALKATFRAPGVLQAALGYYRATLNPANQDPALGELQALIGISPVTVPTLYLHGARDGCIGVDLAEGMEALFPNGLRKVVIPDAGHFVHAEKPDEVNRILLEFLRRA